MKAALTYEEYLKKKSDIKNCFRDAILDAAEMYGDDLKYLDWFSANADFHITIDEAVHAELAEV